MEESENAEIENQYSNIDPNLYINHSGEASFLPWTESENHDYGHQNTISSDTMNQLLLHKEKCKNQNQPAPNVLIVDCRFKYEYEGGHIKNAININCKSDLEK